MQATPGELAEAMVEHPLYGVLLEKQYGKNVHLNSGCGHADKILVALAYVGAVAGVDLLLAWMHGGSLVRCGSRWGMQQVDVLHSQSCMLAILLLHMPLDNVGVGAGKAAWEPQYQFS
jgi:hypothetical protein